MFETYGRLSNNKIVNLTRCLLGEEAYQNFNLILKSLGIRSSRQRQAIKQLKFNNKFHNKYAGKRCFILGNGPSIQDVDLSLLSKEYVFTTNFFQKIEGHDKLTPSFHIFNDNMFFDISNEDKLTDKELNNYYELIQSLDVPCFVPIDGYDYIHRNHWDEKIDINYVCFGAPIGFSEINNINLCKAIPGVNSVVQTAMMIAIYMGFTELYMLGIDGTVIAIDIEERLKNCFFDEELHPYNESSMYVCRKHYTMRERLIEQYNVFAGFENICKYAETRDVKIFNCSSRSLVDGMPRRSLEKVLMS